MAYTPITNEQGRVLRMDPGPTAPGQIPGFGVAPNPYVPQNSTAPTYQAATLPQFQNFTAPTAAEALAEPGTQFGLQQAQLGQERSAAAQGTVLSGGFQKALGDYMQNVAQGFYGNAFSRKLQATGFNNNTAQTGFQDASQNAQNTYANAFQNWAGENALGLTAYNTNYNTSHQAANDYYQALLDQQQGGQQAANQAATA